MSRRHRADATPVAVPAAEEDSALVTAVTESSVKSVSDVIGYLKVIVGFAVLAFVSGGASYLALSRYAAQMATKRDLTAAMAAHAAAPSDPAVVRRLDEIDVWRAAHSAKEEANERYTHESLNRLLDERRIPRPAPPLP